MSLGIISFIVSLFLIVLIFSLAVFEQSKGEKFASSVRGKLDSLMLKMFLFIRDFIKFIHKKLSKDMALAFVHGVASLFSKFTKFVDKKAQRLALRIYKKRLLLDREEGKSSAFLSEVKKHKNSLDIRSKKGENTDAF